MKAEARRQEFNIQHSTFNTTPPHPTPPSSDSLALYKIKKRMRATQTIIFLVIAQACLCVFASPIERRQGTCPPSQPNCVGPKSCFPGGGLVS